MIAKTSFSFNFPLSSVGDVQVPGKKVLFCNGIMNDQIAALESAKMLSSALGGRKVFVYHNSTGLRHYLDAKNGELERQTTDVARSLAKHIHAFVLANQEENVGDPDNCVALFVHSHGAVVAKKALEYLAELSKTAKDHVRVYAFGGATLIPNQLANEVHNYIFHEDIISDLGHAFEKDRATLYQTKKIAKRVKEEGIDLQTAITQQALYEMYIDLHPLFRKAHLEDPETRQTKNERYQRLFRSNQKEALLSDSEYREKIAAYTALFKTYTVTIAEGTPFKKPEFEPIKKERNNSWLSLLEAIGKNISRGVMAVGVNVLDNHTFSKYVPVIQKEGIAV